MRHRGIHRVLLRAVLALAAVGLPRVVGAATEKTEKIELENFREQIGKVAKRIIQIVEGEGQNAVEMVGFVGPRRLNSNSGPGIEESLIAALQQLKPGFVQKKAALTVQGTYKLIDEKGEAGRGFLNLSVEIRDQADEPKMRLDIELRSPPDIARLLQVTGSLREKDVGLGERNREIKKQAEKPSVVISGPDVRANAQRKLSVALAVKPQESAEPAQPRTATDEGGEAYVDIRPGEVYEILVKNGSDEEVAAEITIDGLSVFAFSEKRDSANAFPAYTHYVVAPHSTETIVGWHLRDNPPDNYASFLVSEYGKGNLGSVPRRAQGDTGVVFVAFSHSFPKNSKAGSETGLGPPRSVDVKPVERDIAQPHEFVAIRYSR